MNSYLFLELLFASVLVSAQCSCSSLSLRETPHLKTCRSDFLVQLQLPNLVLRYVTSIFPGRSFTSGVMVSLQPNLICTACCCNPFFPIPVSERMNLEVNFSKATGKFSRCLGPSYTYLSTDSALYRVPGIYK